VCSNKTNDWGGEFLDGVPSGVLADGIKQKEQRAAANGLRENADRRFHVVKPRPQRSDSRHQSASYRDSRPRVKYRRAVDRIYPVCTYMSAVIAVHEGMRKRYG